MRLLARAAIPFFIRSPRVASAAEDKGDSMVRANVVLLTLFLDASSGVRARLRGEEGQAFVEYAMVMLLVAIALAAGTFVSPFRTAIEGAFSSIGDALSNAVP
jgi:Flp pilus assembly pilin Flp